ncbi:MAG: hypothetical protein R3F51_24325 [Cyanobacteriota/Melainabacteria group bacterium]
MSKRSILTFITGLFVLTIFGLGAVLIWISKPENYTSLVMTSREKTPDTANPKKAQLRNLSFTYPGNWLITGDGKNIVSIETPGSSGVKFIYYPEGEELEVDSAETRALIDNFFDEQMKEHRADKPSNLIKQTDLGKESKIEEWAKMKGYGRKYKLTIDSSESSHLPYKFQVTTTNFITKADKDLLLIQEFIYDSTREITAPGFNQIKSTIEIGTSGTSDTSKISEQTSTNRCD